MSDTQLVRQLHDEATSMQAFDEIFEKLFPRLCYFAQGIIHDEEEAKDIVMMGFKKIWDKKNNFDNFSGLTAFLYHVVRHDCYNFLKKSRVKSKHKDELLYLQPLSENEIEKLIDKTEIIQALYAEIEKLPEKCKEVFKMAYLEGMQGGEIAEKLNISVNTVRNHKAKALDLLRLSFGDKQFMVAWLLLLHAIIKN